ncbi:hypothetical protein [Novosphingobium sp. HII-3]|jgi:hypothetical protein|uniref:hypothetical protein n=1 Tax=Novosphingobium sp. HII-3 TaxID=2075565 RepID=UPI000CDB4E6A|nr:hypothetical protein [Novosphingobium sp. HII-3]
MHEVDQPPPHHAMDRRDRPALDHLGKRPAPGIIKDRALAWGLAVQQSVRPSSIQADQPVAYNLQSDAADPPCIATVASIVYLRKRQQTTNLRGAPGPSHQTPTCRFVAIIPKPNCRTHLPALSMQDGID